MSETYEKYGNQKRYILTIDMYLFTNSDAEALREATIIAGRIERFAEHSITDVEVLKIEQKNFGELKAKPIFKLNK